MQDQTTKSRNKWLAAFLSFCCPGLGQLYCGNGKRGLWFFAAYVSLFVGSAGLAFTLNDLRPTYALLWALPLLALVCIIDAWLLARREKAIKPKWFNKWYHYVAASVLSLGVVPIPDFFMEEFHIPARSIQPNLIVGDHLYAKMNPFRAEVPTRGTITLFWNPVQPDEAYIKRLVGLPGDTVQYKAGRLFLNGIVVERNLVSSAETSGRIYQETLPNGSSYQIQETFENASMDETEEYVVPDGHLFFLGDNRDDSQDSRFLKYVGYVPIENIIGTANFISWSHDFSRIGMRIK